MTQTSRAGGGARLRSSLAAFAIFDRGAWPLPAVRQRGRGPGVERGLVDPVKSVVGGYGPASTELRRDR